jgi:hypothetical protein
MNLPAELVTSGGFPRNIALDADRIYWVTEDGFVFSHGRDPGGPSTMLAAGQPHAQSILVDDHYVYWTRYVLGGTVGRVPKGGGAAAEDLATNQKAPLGLAQDCSTIYWTNQNDYGPGEIVKVTK